MAPLVKSLLHKQKRLKFNPKQSCKRLALRAQACNPGSSEAWTGGFLGLNWPQFQERKGGRGREEEGEGWKRSGERRGEGKGKRGEGKGERRGERRYFSLKENKRQTKQDRPHLRNDP